MEGQPAAGRECPVREEAGRLLRRKSECILEGWATADRLQQGGNRTDRQFLKAMFLSVVAVAQSYP